MNIRPFHMAGLYLLLTIYLVHADDLSVTDYVNKYYIEWNTPRAPGDDGGSYRVANFYSEVPSSLKAEVLEQILSRAQSSQPESYGVMVNVFACLRNFVPEMIVTPKLDSDLYAASKDSNLFVRRDILEILGRLKRTKDHSLILAALSDPEDEVRGAAIDALRGRPDAEATFQKFIQDHQSDPAYRTSVLYAKSGLEAIHESKTNAGR